MEHEAAGAKTRTSRIDPLIDVGQSGGSDANQRAAPVFSLDRTTRRAARARRDLLAVTIGCLLVAALAVGFLFARLGRDEPVALPPGEINTPAGEGAAPSMGDREGPADVAAVTSPPSTSLPSATDVANKAAPPETIPSTAAAATTGAPTTSFTTTTTSSTTTPTTSTTTTLSRDPVDRVIGRSVRGQEIVATRFGDAGGVPVLAVGVIHGDEPGGLAITAAMRELEPPPGVALWIIDSVNPDGLDDDTRGNANGVDLNRNADGGSWQPVGEGTDRWSGPGPASEPETRAVQAFLDEVRPVFSVWWHQVGNHVDDNHSVARYDVLERFAALVDLPVEGTSCVTACVGTISGYLNGKLASTAFVVELPSSYGAETSQRHAEVFIQVAAELAAEVDADSTGPTGS